MSKARKITGTDWQGNACSLVHIHNGHTVTEGETVRNFRGEWEQITGGKPPHKAGSTGRVWIKGKATEFFPSVFGLEWRT